MPKRQHKGKKKLNQESIYNRDSMRTDQCNTNRHNSPLKLVTIFLAICFNFQVNLCIYFSNIVYFIAKYLQYYYFDQKLLSLLI